MAPASPAAPSEPVVPAATAMPAAAVGPVHAPRRTAVVASLAGLIVLGLAWELWLAPTGRGSWAIKVLPLVAALPGAWRRRLHTLRWLSLLVWLYVCEGLVRATSERGASRWLAIAQTAVALLLFTACVLDIRRRTRPATR